MAAYVGCCTPSYALSFNPLRTMDAYMRQGNKYFTVCKQIVITSPPFTLQPWNQFHFIYYSLLYILLYWAKHDN